MPFVHQLEEVGYMPVSQASEDNYINNPIEAQAFYFGWKTAAFVHATDAERAGIVAQLDKNAEIDRGYHNSRAQERVAILSAPKPCQCT